MFHDPVPELKEFLNEPLVFINWPKGVKGSPMKWKHLEPAHMTKSYLSRLKYGNIGVALGEVSGGLCALDLDVDQLVQPFALLNPHLDATFQTHGARGRVFWMRMEGNYPQQTKRLKTASDEDIGEFRSNGSQSIAWGIHPDTQKPYEWVVAKPVVRINFDSIKWPESILKPNALQSRTDVIKGGVLVPSDPTQSLLCKPLESYSVKSISEAVELCIPSGPRRNNQALFRLARSLLSLEQSATVGLNDKQAAFEEWYGRTKALGFLRSTQSREHYLIEFMNAIKDAKKPLGETPVMAAWKRTQGEPLPKEANNFTTNAPRQLIGLCYQLEKSSNGQPWFLSCRDAGKLLGISHTLAAEWLSRFVAFGFLIIADAGTTHKATRYRFFKQSAG